MKTLLTPEKTKNILDNLSRATADFLKNYPAHLTGGTGKRQPVHTVYGGAHLFKADTAAKIGEWARRFLAEYAPDAESFAKALQYDGPADLTKIIYSRVLEKLKTEALEDFRIDFEDGYGHRPDAEEDGHAVSAALEVAKGMKQKSLPPFLGFRIKPLTEELRVRSIRTLEIFLATLIEQTGGKLPDNFVVTLPKPVMPEQVKGLADLLCLLEKELSLPPNTFKIELMVETTQAILNAEGETSLPHFIRAAEGRCVSAHFGVYDYTASCNITAKHQVMDHPACDFARHILQVSLMGTGIAFSDGATNVMPVGPHRVSKEGPPLTPQQMEENREGVYRAWRLAYQHIRHSLRHGFYQGWDLHPAQLPIRYAAVYGFFLENLDEASIRLKTFMEKAAQATLVGDIFDDAATGQGLLNYFLRALNCGAITEKEIMPTGLTLDEIRTRSFAKILAGRRKKTAG